MLTPREKHWESARPRWSRQRKLLIAFFGVLCSFGVGAFLLYLAGDSELAKAVAETDRLDSGWRLVDIEAKRATVPDAENSALVLLAAKKLVVKARDQQLVLDSDEVLDDAREQIAHRLNDQQRNALKVILAQYGRTLPACRRVAVMPMGRFPLNYSPDIVGTKLECFEVRECLKALSLDLFDRLDAGDGPGSVESLAAMLNGPPLFCGRPLFWKFKGGLV
jgi:hypothetical protein